MVMNAGDLQQQLYAGQAERQTHTRKLEKERASLTLPAHTGDDAAKARIAAIRLELIELGEATRDVEGAIADLEPRVRKERISAERGRRREQAEYLDRVMYAMVVAASKADRAMTELLDAMQCAGPLVEEARRVAAELTMLPSHGDAGAHAINRMVALDSSALRPFLDLTLARLADIGAIPPGLVGNYAPKTAPLADTLGHARQVMWARVEAVLARDAEQQRADDAPEVAGDLEVA